MNGEQVDSIDPKRLDAIETLKRVGREALRDLESGELHPDALRTRLARSLPAPQSDGDSKLAERWGPLDDDTFDTPPPPRDWILRREHGKDGGVFPRGKLGILGGAGGSGKTSALCRLAIAAALGRPWLATKTDVRQGWYVPPESKGRVLLCLAEEDRDEIRRRLYNAARSMRLDDSDRREALRKIAPLALMGCPSPLLDDRLEPSSSLAFIRDRLEESPDAWSLLVFDPLVRFGTEGTETDQIVATRLLQTFESLIDVPGQPAVMVAHHTNQTSRTPGAPASANDVRGVTALTDNSRWVAILRPVELDGCRRVELAQVKSNYGPPSPVQILSHDSQNSGALRLETDADRKERADMRKAMEEADAEKKRSKKKKTEHDPEVEPRVDIEALIEAEMGDE